MSKIIDLDLIENEVKQLKHMMFTNGKLQILENKQYINYLKNNKIDVLIAFCCKNGIYNIPTKESIDFLKAFLPKDTIEIGSGNGVMAKALGIKATDNYIQDNLALKIQYNLFGQGTVQYGDNVEKIEALEACKKYNPQTVIGAWVSDIQNYSLAIGQGVDEEYIIHNHNYLFIGHKDTHKDQHILKYPHKTFNNFLPISKKGYEGNVILYWEKQKI